MDSPNLPKFIPLTLELISIIYKYKVKMYFVSGFNLCCNIYNHNYKKCIRLLRVVDYHFEAMFAMKLKSTFKIS